MSTTFTMNTLAVHTNREKLLEIGAVPMMLHEETPTRWDDCYCGGNCNWKAGLPAATTFRTLGTYSRNQLTKMFGKSAMVRGVEVT